MDSPCKSYFMKFLTAARFTIHFSQSLTSKKWRWDHGTWPTTPSACTKSAHEVEADFRGEKMWMLTLSSSSSGNEMTFRPLPDLVKKDKVWVSPLKMLKRTNMERSLSIQDDPSGGEPGLGWLWFGEFPRLVAATVVTYCPFKYENGAFRVQKTSWHL